MRQYNPQIADFLIKAAKSSKTNVCSRDKQCVGYIEGKYWYSDGSKGFGRDITKYRAELDKNVFCWHE